MVLVLVCAEFQSKTKTETKNSWTGKMSNTKASERGSVLHSLGTVKSQARISAGITLSKCFGEAKFSSLHSLSKQVSSASLVLGAAERPQCVIDPSNSRAFLSTPSDLLGLSTLKHCCLGVEYLDRAGMEDMRHVSPVYY